MSIEIEVLNGDESWPLAKPLFEAVWPTDVVQKLPWGHVRWANADLRVMIETPSDGLACHVGVYFRNVTWNGRKLHIGGVGGVSTRADCRRRGYASIALDAAIRTMRDREDVRFALLFCEPHFRFLSIPRLASF
jgi:aminoglycoside 2'-N-acetyltransferase I